MKLTDIPQFTDNGNYQIHVSWHYLEEWLKDQQDDLGLDLSPDFQRVHVWDKSQQSRFVEFCLRGGMGSNILRFNCVGWGSDYRGPFELVDGKQRLEAVREFLRNNLMVFSKYRFDYDDGQGQVDRIAYNFVVQINNLVSRSQILQWYLDINTGGVVHTDEEIEKVRNLLSKEKELDNE